MKNIIISPSILSADFANLERDIKTVEKYGADWLHVDVMDGHFVPNITIGVPVVKSLKAVSSIPLDVHLMIENPEKYCEYDIQTKQLQYLIMSIDGLCDLKGSKNYVLKKAYKQFSKAVGELYEFLHIFKSDLKNIEIDRKENKDFWLCDLIMVYDDYKVHAEFESTGIKKLIRLFTYLQKMVRGEIVFIDEFDSNLHDVYLCAILEYLMEHGKGQLCFTTHNVGPMDVLRRRKKSIDFLSENHKIYPWTANGNYSPAKLYRNGMIEGSPFNVDSIDFIGVFDSGEEDE